MTSLVIEATAWLLYFEAILRRKPFHVLHEAVRCQPIRTTSDRSATEMNHAMDIACAIYFRRVLCLQRSAATTVLLRRHGLAAEMVVGVRLLPFKSHAWVEVAGSVVNDKPYIGALYRVLERC